MPTREEIDAAKERLKTSGVGGISALSTSAPMNQGAGKTSREDIDKIKESMRGRTTEDILKSVSSRGAPAVSESKSITDYALEGLGSALETVDSYTGAPTRAAVSQTINDSRRDPSMLPGPDWLPKPLKVGANAVGAFAKQFGEPTSGAPTGKQIATQLGASTESKWTLPVIGEVSPAGVAGLAVDIGADWTNLVPLSWIAKTAARGAKKGANLVTRAASDAVKASAPGKRVANIVDDISERFGKPAQAKDWKELEQTAKELNINPLELPAEFEFGPRGTITNIEKSLRQGAGSDKYVDAFNASLDKVRQSAAEALGAIGGGRLLSAEEGGKALRDAYDIARSKFFDDLATSYNKIGAEYSLQRLAPEALGPLQKGLSKIEKDLVGTAQDVTSSQRAQTREALQTIRELKELSAKRGLNAQEVPVFNQMVGKLRGLGRAAFPKKNELLTNPPNVAVYGELYDLVRKALIDTVRYDTADGAKLADALLEANASQKQFFSNTSILKDIGNPLIDNERLFRNLVYNGNSLKIDAIKDLWSRAQLSPESFKDIKSAMLGEILTKASSGVDETLSFQTAGSIFKRQKNQLEKILTPEEMEKVARTIRFGERFGQMYLNNSWTGSFLSLQNMKQFVLGTASNEAALAMLKNRAREGVKKGSLLPQKMNAPIFEKPSSSSFLKEKAALTIPKVFSSQQNNRSE